MKSFTLSAFIPGHGFIPRVLVFALSSADAKASLLSCYPCATVQSVEPSVDPVMADRMRDAIRRELKSRHEFKGGRFTPRDNVREYVLRLRELERREG